MKSLVSSGCSGEKGVIFPIKLETVAAGLTKRFWIRVRAWAQRADLRLARARAMRSLDTPGTIGKLTLVEYLPESPTIVEVGAHEGSDTEEFALLFPSGRVIAFEAHPQLFARAYERSEKFDNVTCVNAALSNKSAVATFHQSSGTSNASGSVLKPTTHLDRHPSVTFRPEDQIVVVSTTLDEYLEAMDVLSIDLIWIDVQGAEQLVLRGAQRTLTQTKWVYAEVSEIPLYQGATTYSELKTFLAEFNFEVYAEFLPTEWLGEGNVLFIRR